MTELCGYCNGSGQVETREYDREGRANDGPTHRTCEYCDGSGQCEEGGKLLPALTRGDMARRAG